MNPDHLVLDSRSESAPAWSWPRTVLAFLCFTVGVLGTTWGIHQAYPVAEHSPYRQKRSLLAEAQPEPDTLFFGSSRILRHLSPAVFDTTMAERGIETHSFNMALPAMMTLEQESLLALLLATPPTALRYVIIDPEEFLLVTPPGQLRTTRSIGWHTAPATWITLQELAQSERRLQQKITGGYEHILACVYRAFHFGQLRTQLVTNKLHQREELPSDQTAPSGRGFMSLDQAYEEATGEYRERLEGRKTAFRTDLAGYERRVDTLRQSLMNSDGAFENEFAVVRRLRDMIRATGAIPIFLIAPGVGHGNRNYVRQAHARGDIEHLIDLAHPDEYPAFYDPEQLFDANHLNSHGAEAISRELAHKIADAVERGELPRERTP